MHLDKLSDFLAYFVRPEKLLSRVPESVTMTNEVWAAVAADPDVIERIIRMKGLADVVLLAASTHENERVRMKLAQKQALPLDVVELLSRDPEPSIRRRLTRNPSTPRDVLEHLLNDACAKVRDGAEKRLAEDRATSA